MSQTANPSVDIISNTNPITNLSTGIVYVSRDSISYIEFDEFLHEDNYQVLVDASKDSDKQRQRLRGENTVSYNYQNAVFRGSGGCVVHNGEKYIATNYHVVETLKAEMLDRIYYEPKSDIAFIPIEVIQGSVNSENYKCSRIAMRDSLEVSLNGIGDQFYYFQGYKTPIIGPNPFSPSSQYIQVNLTFSDGDFPLWGKGLSGSLVYNANGEVTGLVKEMSTSDPGDDKDYLYLVDLKDLREFALKLP